MKKSFKMRSLRVEKLEGRQMLAGGLGLDLLATLQQALAAKVAAAPAAAAPAPSPTVKITNNRVPVLNLMPADTDKLIADMTLRAYGKRQYYRLTEVQFLSAWGSEPLASVGSSFTLKADLNGKAKDGCEAYVGSGQADWRTDLLNISLTRAVWVRNANMRVQVYANISSYPSGDTLGVELVSASFKDLKGREVAEESVVYAGVDPVIHNIDNAMVEVNQQPLAPFSSVQPGDKDVAFVRFDIWTINSVVDTLSFTPTPGVRIADITNPVLKYDSNWDGKFESTITGTVSGGLIKFNLGKSTSNGVYELHADVVANPAGKYLQFAFPADGAGLTGHNAETGKALKPANQIRLWPDSDRSTLYNIVAPPAELTIAEIPAAELYCSAMPGQTGLVMASGTFSAAVDLMVTQFAIVDMYRDLRVFANYTLWVDKDADGEVDTKVVTGNFVEGDFGYEVYFNNFELNLKAGSNTRYEVRADAPDPPISYRTVQVSLAAPGEIKATKFGGSAVATDKLFEQSARQSSWWINYGGGLG